MKLYLNNKDLYRRFCGSHKDFHIQKKEISDFELIKFNFKNTMENIFNHENYENKICIENIIEEDEGNFCFSGGNNPSYIMIAKI